MSTVLSGYSGYPSTYLSPFRAKVARLALEGPLQRPPSILEIADAHQADTDTDVAHWSFVRVASHDLFSRLFFWLEEKG